MSATLTSEYWHARAKEARAVAEWIKDPEARCTMLGIAQSYDHLAKRSEDRERRGEPPLYKNL
jgi:hypothetical protein